MTLPTLINYGLYAIVGVFALVCFLLGFKRGFSRQTVKFIFVGASFALSFIAFGAIYPALYSLVEGKSVADVASTLNIGLSEEIYKFAVCIKGDTAVYLASVPLAIVVFPFGFLAMFFAVNGLLVFPYIVICGALGFGSQYNTTLTRILGGVVGIVQGVLMALLVIMPVEGIVDIAGEAITVSEEKHPDSQNAITIGNIYHQNVDGVIDNPVLKYSDDAFGFVYDKFSTIKVEGEDVSVHEIADDLFELFVLYGDLGADFNFKSLTEDNKATIDKMLECFGNDHIMTAIVSGALSSVGKAANSGAFTFDAGEPMQSLYMAFLDVCSTCDSTTVEGDLYTLTRVYYLFSDEGMLQAETVSSMFASFLVLDAEGSSAFKRMVAILDENPRFNTMSETCSRVAMDLLIRNTGVDQDVMETVTNVKAGINSVVGLNKEDYATEEEYKADVNKGISETLTENNISMSDEKLDQLTDFVIENYGDKDEITDDEFLDFMSKYYDTYAKSSGAGSSTEGAEGTEGTESIEGAEGTEGTEGTEP